MDIYFTELEIYDDEGDEELQNYNYDIKRNFWSSNQSKPRKRTKRQTDQYEYTPTKTRCPLLLVADYRFFQEMGGGNTKTTINYLVRSL